MIALTTVAVAASALFASLAQTKVYRATAVVRVPSDTGAELASLRAARLRAAVARQAGITPRVTVTRAARPDELRVTAEADSARGAANLANGYVALHLAQVHDDQVARTAGAANDLQARMADIQAQLDALAPQIAAARPSAAGPLVARRDTLQGQLTDLEDELTRLTAVPGPELAAAARPPGSPSSPDPVRNTLIGLVAGLLVGLFVAFALEVLTRRARRPEDATEPTAKPAKPAKPAKGDKRPPPLVPAGAAVSPPAPAPRPQPAPEPELSVRPQPVSDAPPRSVLDTPVAEPALTPVAEAALTPVAEAAPTPVAEPALTPVAEAPAHAAAADQTDEPQQAPAAPEPLDAPEAPEAPEHPEHPEPPAVVPGPEQAAAAEPEEEPAVERSGPGVPVLGMIPAVFPWRGTETPLLRRDQPTSPAAEAYRALAATLQHILPHRPLRSVVVTSPASGDGRTTVVANLGIVLARAGRTVVVVDCDLRNPQLHTLYGLPNEAGFTSVLRGEAPLSRAVQDAPGEPRLQVLAAGPTPPAPGQLLSAQRTVEVLAALQAQADVVVIDTPTMAPNSDAAVVASIADSALVIAGAPAGQAGELARAVDLLGDIEGLVVGVVLNAVTDDDHDGRVAMLRRDMPRVSLA